MVVTQKKKNKSIFFLYTLPCIQTEVFIICQSIRNMKILRWEPGKLQVVQQVKNNKQKHLVTLMLDYNILFININYCCLHKHLATIPFFKNIFSHLCNFLI